MPACRCEKALTAKRCVVAARVRIHCGRCSGIAGDDELFEHDALCGLNNFVANI